MSYINICFLNYIVILKLLQKIILFCKIFIIFILTEDYVTKNYILLSSIF